MAVGSSQQEKAFFQSFGAALRKHLEEREMKRQRLQLTPQAENRDGNETESKLTACRLLAESSH